MTPRPRPLVRLAREALMRALATLGAAALTLALLLVLPLFQVIAQEPEADLLVREVDVADVPPPPPPPEEEPEEEEPEEEPPPPELTEVAEPLDLSQLEMALDTSVGEGWLAGDFAVRLDRVAAVAQTAAAEDELLSSSDLDQKPRAIHQPEPVLDAALRRKTPATVSLIFTVDPDGRVKDPAVLRTTDPAFDRVALAAIKQWRFEPGKRNGRPVEFRMRIPITFKRGS